MSYQLRPATRTAAKPLIGLYAQSGGGKTYSALVLARGFVGPTGRIAMIETESGRGEAFADPAEYPEIGGYDVITLSGNFAAAEYGAAIQVAEQAGVDALIIDSASHEWEGVNGVLDQAAQNMAAGKKGVLAWQRPKIDHKQHFMLKVMQSKIPLVILCMRAKYPMREVEVKGRKQWVRADDLEPIQADDVLYEMFVHGWLSVDDHVFHMTKCTAKALEPVFGGNQRISADTGAKLADWAKAAPAPKPEPATGAPISPADEEKDPRAVSYQETAFAHARGGIDTYRDWFTTLTTDERLLVQPVHEECKAIAAAVATPEPALEGE